MPDETVRISPHFRYAEQHENPKKTKGEKHTQSQKATRRRAAAGRIKIHPPVTVRASRAKTHLALETPGGERPSSGDPRRCRCFPGEGRGMLEAEGDV
ncbi:hypothetical protein CRG98_043855 [Punica granatum]|uniref:Uncharacterized protein n=1 Tax=Punica granatum TaxID=22663 RepID=A0A2I0HVH3_PUNGR|nr:hypothetical protein CRG98_043855 [Punica granatum]